MNKVVYLKKECLQEDAYSRKLYFDFLDYAFSKADYFMLVYVNYYGKGYTNQQKHFRDSLKKFKVKSRNNPSWPGTPKTFSRGTTYKITFYKTSEDAKEILKEVSCLSSWSRPINPEDLAFFKGNQCWFYSTGHEKIAAIIHADNEDIEFLISKGLATREAVSIPTDNYFDSYNEPISEVKNRHDTGDSSL